MKDPLVQELLHGELTRDLAIRAVMRMQSWERMSNDMIDRLAFLTQRGR